MYCYTNLVMLCTFQTTVFNKCTYETLNECTYEPACQYLTIMKWVTKYVENVCPGIRLRLAMPLTKTKIKAKSINQIHNI